MSKQDNLTDFLTDVADAIREKKGTTEKINPQNFSEEIRGIQSGGGWPTYDDTGEGVKRFEHITIGDNVKGLVAQAYYYCTNLKSVYVPSNCISIGVEAFKFCASLTDVTLSEGVKDIGNGAFESATSISTIVIPSTLTSFNHTVFRTCTSLKYVDMRNASVVITLSNVSAFASTTCPFVVPDNLYDEWIAATNWSTYANRIVKASEFVEPTNNE